MTRWQKGIVILGGVVAASSALLWLTIVFMALAAKKGGPPPNTLLLAGLVLLLHPVILFALWRPLKAFYWPALAVTGFALLIDAGMIVVPLPLDLRPERVALARLIIRWLGFLLLLGGGTVLAALIINRTAAEGREAARLLARPADLESRPAEEQSRILKTISARSRMLAEKRKSQYTAFTVFLLILGGFLFGGPMIGLLFAMVGAALLSGRTLGKGPAGFGRGPV